MLLSMRRLSSAQRIPRFVSAFSAFTLCTINNAEDTQKKRSGISTGALHSFIHNEN
jgi:hypothetical protein